MRSSKPIVAIIFFYLLFLVNWKLHGQDSTGVNVQQKGKYAFILYAGGGWFEYAAPVGSPAIASSTSYTRGHPIGTARIMWHPDHRLRIGLETGYVDFYEYSVKNGAVTGNLKLTGIPVVVVWSMALSKRLNIFAGVGYYLLTTHLDYNGKVVSRSTSLGVNASVNYVQPLSTKLGIGIECKWTEASQTKDYGLSAQMMLVWKFFEW